MWGIGDRDSPLSPENMNRPAFTKKFQDDLTKWRQELGEVVEHEPNALPSGLTYDRPCGPTKCEATADADTARRMLDRLQSVLPLHILDVFVVFAGATTHAFMVAHRIGRPAKLTLLRLRLRNPTTDGHLIHGTNTPWHFEFCAREVAVHSCLDFDLDIVCLIGVAKSCRRRHVDTVRARSISKVMPTSLTTFTATQAGKVHVLTSPHLEDLRELAGDCPVTPLTEDNGLADLRELHDEPRWRGKPAAASSTEEESNEGVFEYEEELRVAGLAELAALPEPPKGASAQPESDAEGIAVADADAELLPDPPAADLKPLAVIDDAAFDGWLQTAGLHKNVVDPHPAAASHLPLGQLQPMGALGGLLYKAVVRCKLPGHIDCSRMRNWRLNSGELPSAVDRALVAWQVQGRTVMPLAGETLTDAHMKLPRH